MHAFVPLERTLSALLLRTITVSYSFHRERDFCLIKQVPSGLCARETPAHDFLQPDAAHRIVRYI